MRGRGPVGQDPPTVVRRLISLQGRPGTGGSSSHRRPLVQVGSGILAPPFSRSAASGIRELS
jgi:hypothetical protein